MKEVRVPAVICALTTRWDPYPSSASMERLPTKDVVPENSDSAAATRLERCSTSSTQDAYRDHSQSERTNAEYTTENSDRDIICFREKSKFDINKNCMCVYTLH